MCVYYAWIYIRLVCVRASPIPTTIMYFYEITSQTFDRHAFIYFKLFAITTVGRASNARNLINVCSSKYICTSGKSLPFPFLFLLVIWLHFPSFLVPLHRHCHSLTYLLTDDMKWTANILTASDITSVDRISMPLMSFPKYSIEVTPLSLDDT